MSKQVDNSALAEALAGVDIGWYVFATPKGSKATFAGSHGYKDATNDPEMVRAWAREHPGCNFALATGVESKVVALDVDPRNGGNETLAKLRPDLSDTASVGTPSGGEHIYFAVSSPTPSKEKPFGPGVEVKGDGNHVLLPGSSTRKGVYRWLKSPADIPIAPLPEFIIQTIRPMSGQNVAERAECNLSDSSAHSACSAHSATALILPAHPDEVIKRTLPERAGERHARVFDLARGLKLDCGITDMGQLREIVRRWHRLAINVITTKSFDETWSDFLNAFERCKVPLAIRTVDVAAENVLKSDLPDVVANYDDPRTHNLIGLCYQLHLLSNLKDGVFFLSSHDVAHRLDMKPVEAWRRLRMLCSDGVLKVMEPGSERRATRYLWTGDEGGDE